jgi:hypothetical protein
MANDNVRSFTNLLVQPVRRPRMVSTTAVDVAAVHVHCPEVPIFMEQD